MKQLPKNLLPYYEKLSENGKALFKKEFNRKRKSSGVAYILWIIFGWHYAYLGKWGLQLLYWLSGGGFLVWMALDLFRTGMMVKKYNNKLASSVMQEIRSKDSK